MTSEAFTLGLYVEYLELALAAGYRFVGFGEVESEPPIILLRHDIDYSPQRAVEMARLEERLGVRATYCVHTSCPWYSVDLSPHRAAVEAILDAGHELGLHFDASEIPTDDLVVQGVQREATSLQELFGVPVRAVSFHMPGRRTVGSIELPDGLVNAYGPRFFHEIAYVSDSNQNWRGTEFETMLSEATERIQLLIHPFWWRERYSTIGNKLDELAAKLGVSPEDIATWEQQELIRAGH